MNTDQLGGVENPGGNTPAPGQGASDLAEIERIRTENAQMAAVLSQLEPYADDIKRYVQDEDYRRFVSESRQYYDQGLEQRKPKLDAATQAAIDAVKEQFQPVLEVANDFKAQREQASTSARQRAFDEGKAILVPFLEQHPELKGSTTFGRTLDLLQEEAASSGRPFKEVWDGYISAFAGPQQRRMPTQPQLRANAGEPGIPAEQRVRPSTRERPTTIRDAFLQTHARLNGKAS
ncbi:MAG: hypothetical protein KGL39_32580 [Patescibacteria group bacterium]|nr:hypothetical protein [Patescibacteria group bacterium]